MFNTDNVSLTFSLCREGELKQVNPTLSKGRVRIFYKGMNPNRTFISDDFANQLIESLPYTPVKGIFDKDTLDYEGHGEDNTDGKIYGVVAADPRFAWEEHLDEDGITRTYACADVYYFTGLYPEASLIPGKGESMEIYRKTLKGEWRISEYDGQPYFHFISGCLLGLQCLGDYTDPCFEGASFFEKTEGINAIINYIKKINKQEAEQMNKDLNNSKSNDSAEPVPNNFSDESVTEPVAPAAEPTNEPVTEPISEPTPEPTPEPTSEPTPEPTPEPTTEPVTEPISEPTAEPEKTEFEIEKEKWEVEKANYESKIAELEKQNSEFNDKISTLEAEKVVLNNKISDIKNENEKLSAFKQNKDTEEKNAILEKYEQYLSEENIQKFKDSIANYSVEDFRKEVCTTAVESDPSIFSKRESQPQTFFKCDSTNVSVNESGAIRILNQYKNGGNK